MATTMLRLRTEDEHSYIGLDCECCLNQCRRSEFQQYCKYPGRRRRKRDTARGKFSQAAIDALYNQINTGEPPDVASLPKFPIDNLDQIRKAKIKNIRKRLLSNIFGWFEPDVESTTMSREGRRDLKHAPGSKVSQFRLEKQQQGSSIIGIFVKAPPLVEVTATASDMPSTQANIDNNIQPTSTAKHTNSHNTADDISVLSPHNGVNNNPREEELSNTLLISEQKDAFAKQHHKNSIT